MRLTPTRNKFKTFPTRTKLLTMHFPKKRPEDHILRHAFVLTSGIFNPILELNRNFYTACLCHNIITYFVMIKRVLCFTIPHGKFVYNISIFKDNNLRKKFRVRQTTIMIAQSVRSPSDRRVQNRQRLLFFKFRNKLHNSEALGPKRNAKTPTADSVLIRRSNRCRSVRG